MSWLEKLGMGGPPPERKPDAAPVRGKGQAARMEENVSRYKESIGLLQQIAVEGLKYLQTESDFQIRTLGLVDETNDPAHLTISTHRGTVIQVRVPGKTEAKELQRIMAKASPVTDGYNFLQRQPCKTLRDGQPTYRIFLPIGEFRDGQFQGSYFRDADGHDIPRLTPDQAKELLEKTLRHMHIQPDWQRYYVHKDRTSTLELARQEEEYREAEEAQLKQARGRRDGRKTNEDDLSPGEQRAKARWKLGDDGSITRG